MPENSIERLNFYQGQFLRAQDFRDEQLYHRDGRRRHNLGPHTWGIVAGLELVERDPESGAGKDVFVQPGLAVDGYGREVLVFRPFKLDTRDFLRFATDNHYEVWIAYDEEPVNRIERGYGGCEDEYNRTRETYRIFVEPETPQPARVTVDGRLVGPPTGTDDPSNIPPDLSVPWQELPDDPRERWMIRLGSVRWTGSGFDQAAAGRLTQGRQYAGAVAALLYSPSGELRMRHRLLGQLDPGESGIFVDVEGQLQVERDAIAKANLHIDGGQLDFRLADGSEGGLYGLRRVESDTGYDLQVRIGDQQNGDNRLVVGPQTGNAPGDFKPALAVADNANVGVRAPRPEHALQVGDGSAPVSLSLRGPDLDAAAAFLAFEDTAGTGSRWFHLVHDTQANLLKVASAEIDPIITFGRTTGRVGIGTVTPDRLLTLSGPEGTYLNVIADAGAHQVLLGADGNGGIVSTMTNHDLQLRAGSNSTKVIIKASGDVGVGTLTPSTRLHVAGGRDVDLSDPAGFLVLGDVNNLNVAFDDNEIQARNNGAASTLYLQAEGGTLNVHAIGSASQRFVILADGRVGIGTNNPSSKLQVFGSIRLGVGGDRFALGALNDELRVVVGQVNGSGVTTGSGYTASRTAAGEYTVSFSPGFASVPIVVASTSNSDEDHVISVKNITAGSFQASGRDVGNFNGDPQDTPFNFIALGAV